MTTITTKPLFRFSFSSLFKASEPAAPPKPVRTIDGRTLDAETVNAIRDLPPHILRDIGITDF